MTTSTKQQDELDALKADLAALRDDVSAIAASLRDLVNQAGQARNEATGAEANRPRKTSGRNSSASWKRPANTASRPCRMSAKK